MSELRVLQIVATIAGVGLLGLVVGALLGARWAIGLLERNSGAHIRWMQGRISQLEHMLHAGAYAQTAAAEAELRAALQQGANGLGGGEAEEELASMYGASSLRARHEALRERQARPISHPVGEATGYMPPPDFPKAATQDGDGLRDEDGLPISDDDEAP